MGPVITLTTDFGSGRYVAQVKGVLLSRCPDAVLVDIAHDLAPHDIVGAAYLLRDAVPAFPPGTIHLAVVDPGVGTARRALAVRTGLATSAQFLVGPDNGIFTELLEGASVHEIVRSGSERVPSPVFHGRDVFAPAAARLASGVGLDNLGPVVGDPVRLNLPRACVRGREVLGHALFADRFGNIATDIEASQIPEPGGGGLVIEIGSARLQRVDRTFGDVPVGGLVALVGSSGRLEIAVREGSAAERLNLGGILGAPVRISARDSE